MRLIFCLLVSSFLTFKAYAADSDLVLPVNGQEIKIMNYNVENLFDADHDDDKQDFEFLPKGHPLKKNCSEAGSHANACYKTDWTDPRVDLKIQQIGKIVQAQGSLPDILVLVEVENPKVVGRLAAYLGYDDFRMTDSPDVRGIDTAVLFKKTKLTLIGYEEAELENAHHPTRNMSAALFQLSKNLGGGILAVIPNHWPSQASPPQARVGVAKAVGRFLHKVKEAYGKVRFDYVLTGDFNVIPRESPSAIDDVLLSDQWEDELFDIHQEVLNSKNPLVNILPPGTYYYGKTREWNIFDRFFVNSDLLDGKGLDVELNSFRILNPGFATVSQNREWVPMRYEHNSSSASSAGYSDHFSIVMKLQFSDSK